MSLTEDDKQWIRGELERVATTLLTEFHKSASPVEGPSPGSHPEHGS